MKRFSCLLLCLLLLFAVGCQKQETLPDATPTPEKGMLYEADGVIQNTLVTAVVVEEDLVAPLTHGQHIRVKIYNGTDYLLRVTHPGTDPIYTWQNGQWQQTTGEIREIAYSPYIFDSKGVNEITITVEFDEYCQNVGGVYRAKFEFGLEGVAQNDALNCFYAYAYFTVKPTTS